MPVTTPYEVQCAEHFAAKYPGKPLPVIGYTQSDLDLIWDQIRNKSDWRAEVSTDVSLDDLPLALLAVEFFTATKAKVTGILVDQETGEQRIRIYAVGYRRGPAY